VRYDAFISYSHAADGRLAPALQSALHRLARPWYRRQALRVFRDQTNLAASPTLWPRIESALQESRVLILLASPESARSKWVRREIEAWRAKPQRGAVYIVLTEGAAVWDEQARDFDYTASTGLSDALRGLHEDEPHWLDLTWARSESDLSLKNPRFADVAATLAAELRGVDKDAIIGEDIRQHRRTRRIAATAIVTLAVLLAAAVASLVVARQQLRRARENLAETLATNALSGADGRDTSLLTAVAASRLAPTVTARAALLRLVQQNRHVVRMLYSADQRVNLTSLAVSEQGEVAAGTYGGGIERWDQSGRRRSIETESACWITLTNGTLQGVCEGSVLYDEGRMTPLPVQVSTHAAMPVLVARARRADAMVIASEADELLVTCRSAACSQTPLGEMPSALALSDDGTTTARGYGSAVQIGERRVDLYARVLAIVATDAGFDVVLESGTRKRIGADTEAVDVPAPAVAIPRPHYEQANVVASSDLRWLAMTDAFGGIGLRDVDSAVTLLTATAPANGRLARFDRRPLPSVTPRKAPPAVNPNQLPAWRDGDDHEVEVFAYSRDGAGVATITNVVGEGSSARIVIRNGDAAPLLIDASETLPHLAVGRDFVAGAGTADGNAYLWNRYTGAVASEPFRLTGEVRHLEFAGDDAALTIWYTDGRAETLDLTLPSLQRHACEIANRDLSADEWRARMPSLPYEAICTSILGRPLASRW
jgi:hypothetical protein